MERQLDNVIYLSLGSNLGDSISVINKAYDLINSTIGTIVSKSSVYTSKAWGFDSENQFYNSCIGVSTKKTPNDVLIISQNIEKQLGRSRKTSDTNNYSDRVIDIDILIYGKTILSTRDLTIPHPLLHHRNFVLVPLTEIAPHLIHPKLSLTIEQILENSNDNVTLSRVN